MTLGEERRVHCLVRGFVHGVYFRVSTQKEAMGLNLGGWVRNVPDGRVELEAQGPAVRVGQLIDWLHEGPARARVGEVFVSERVPEPGGAGHGFEILH